MLTERDVLALQEEYSNDLQRRRYINELRKGEVTPEIQERIDALLYKGKCPYVYCGKEFKSEYRTQRFCSPACRNCFHARKSYQKSQAAKQTVKAAA